ncbi:MAG: sugar ABC transporter permease [Acidimicrobiaceae bacterium]|nr:sugar ABC transporter permease [Acidimicrobiaceae bacterium]
MVRNSQRVTNVPKKNLIRRMEPIYWLGPAFLLIAGVVIMPVAFMVWTSFRNIDTVGFDHGFAGLASYRNLFALPDLRPVIIRTIVWLISVVSATMLIALPLAVLLNRQFPGRRAVRMALVAPWATSVFMTAIIFRWMLQPQSGLINIVGHALGLLHNIGLTSAQADWLGRPQSAFVWMIIVAIFVSLPFTTYTLLAGMQAIPGDIYEAAKVDGASAWRSFRAITMPLLKPAAVVALLINLMNVFNSFPIIWEMTRGGPGDQTATSTVFMYQLKSSSIPMAAAMSVVNFVVVAVIVIMFLRFSNWKERTI